MKKIAILLLLVVFAASAASADSALPNDNTYKELDQLKNQIRRMKKEVDSFVKELASTYPESGKLPAEGWGQDVKVDVTENDKEVIVRADLPGMDKDKIEVTLDQGKMLKIAGARESYTSQTTNGVVKQERMTGSFSRTLELPAECRNDGIKASYNSGVLDIVIPKKPKSKDETVKIRVS